MNIEIYALCHQEAPMIPYFMRHYKQYGQVFLFEGHSTDGSAALARSLGAIVIPIDTGNEIRDDIFTDIKNNCWKDSRADWVIICDTDEFVYHPILTEYLKTLNDTVIAPESYEMFSDTFPITSGQIYSEVNMGFRYDAGTNCKLCLFRPQALTDINYEPGSHKAHPVGNVRINYNSGVVSMHMRHLSVEYVVNRNLYYRQRRSSINKTHGWGFHVEATRAEVQEWFDIHKPNLVKVPII
jgi:hypothetical protein